MIVALDMGGTDWTLAIMQDSAALAEASALNRRDPAAPARLAAACRAAAKAGRERAMRRAIADCAAIKATVRA